MAREPGQLCMVRNNIGLEVVGFFLFYTKYTMTPILLRTYFLNVKHLKMPQMKLKCFLDEKTQELEWTFFSLG